MENRLRILLGAVLGVAAFTLPELAPWSLLLALAAALLLPAGTMGKPRLIAAVLAASLFVGIAGGLLPVALVTAVLAAFAVAGHHAPMALTILLLQSSYGATLEALLGNALFQGNLEAAAPGLLGASAVVLATMSWRPWRMLLALLPLPLVYGGVALGFSPYGLMTLGAVPGLLLAAWVPKARETDTLRTPKVVALVLLAAGLAGWLLTPPKLPAASYVLLPGAMESPEGKFYRNYAEVLGFSGLNAYVIESPETIPENSVVLLPWLTASDREDAPSLERIRMLALERGWVVVMVGEHTNMGGVAERVATVAGRPMLRNDLSVPPGNTDDSGPMRVGSLRAWPPEAIFNRGASVEVHSLLDRVLLAGDGWWAEPDIGEWLWVGDYRWRPGDRHGRLVMAASADEGRARWVVVGDTGPFINQQLVTDPRSAAQLLQMATLWPLFLRDAGLAAMGLLFLFGWPAGEKVRRAALAAAGIAAISSGALWASLADDVPAGGWRTLWRQESGFDERNFNQALVASPALLTSDWLLVRPRGPLTGHHFAQERPVVVFGLVEDALSVGEVRLSDCKRLGSLDTGEVFLMDAQACRMSGAAEVLVGDKDEAAAARIPGPHPVILVLDQNFLGQKAPIGNRLWLENQLRNIGTD